MLTFQSCKILPQRSTKSCIVSLRLMKLQTWFVFHLRTRICPNTKRQCIFVFCVMQLVWTGLTCNWCITLTMLAEFGRPISRIAWCLVNIMSKLFNSRVETGPTAGGGESRAIIKFTGLSHINLTHNQCFLQR